MPNSDSENRIALLKFLDENRIPYALAPDGNGFYMHADEGQQKLVRRFIETQGGNAKIATAAEWPAYAESIGVKLRDDGYVAEATPEQEMQLRNWALENPAAMRAAFPGEFEIAMGEAKSYLGLDKDVRSSTEEYLIRLMDYAREIGCEVGKPDRDSQGRIINIDLDCVDERRRQLMQKWMNETQAPAPLIQTKAIVGESREEAIARMSRGVQAALDMSGMTSRARH